MPIGGLAKQQWEKAWSWAWCSKQSSKRNKRISYVS